MASLYDETQKIAEKFQILAAMICAGGYQFCGGFGQGIVLAVMPSDWHQGSCGGAYWK